MSRLFEFFDQFMTQGEFPSLWKIAQIAPIQKWTIPKYPNDYRLILSSNPL